MLSEREREHMARVAEPAFTILERDGDFEVRAYVARVVAETVVDRDWSQSGNEGFRRLAGFIFGKNNRRAKLAMTAPVGQRAESRTMAMAAPVAQRAQGSAWVVSFTMPEGETLESLPLPLDEHVTLRGLAPQRFAVVRFSGRCTEATLRERTEALRRWTLARGFSTVGEPEVNRYDPPWTLWFLRRNEIWLALA